VLRYINQGAAAIRRQRELVRRLEETGHDTADARSLLLLLEDVQKQRRAHARYLALDKFSLPIKSQDSAKREHGRLSTDSLGLTNTPAFNGEAEKPVEAFRAPNSE
jgi:hypothetical protein